MSFDVDIDVKNHTSRDSFGVCAVIYDKERKAIRKHNSGYYIDCNMPVDPITELAAIDYKEAEDMGFIKIDLLTNSSYDMFDNKQEIIDAMNKEPDWDLLLDEDFVSGLPQVGNQHKILWKVKPRSIQELADVLALIRPGKSYLLERYLRNRERVRKSIYMAPKEGAYFKKSHAIAYATMLVCVINKKDKIKFFEL